MRIVRSKSQKYRYWKYTRTRRAWLWSNIVLFSSGGSLFALGYFLNSPWLRVLGGAILLVGSLRWGGPARRLGLFEAGMKGEHAVDYTLGDGLDDSFVLVNGLVLRGQQGDIDHVLVGPTGIFVIETKNYSGYVRCQGDEWTRKPSRNARRYKEIALGSPAKAVLKDVEAVTRRLSAQHTNVPIIPLVVFPNPDVVLSLKSPLVRVLRLEDLLHIVKAPKSCLTPAQVESIVGLLTQPAPKASLAGNS